MFSSFYPQFYAMIGSYVRARSVLFLYIFPLKDAFESRSVTILINVKVWPVPTPIS